MIGEKTKLDRVNEVLKTMTEMTTPNMSLGGRGSHVMPYLSANIETDLTKRVGGDYQSVGTLQANLLFSFLNVEQKWDSSGGLDVKLHFLHPHYEEVADEENEWL